VQINVDDYMGMMKSARPDIILSIADYQSCKAGRKRQRYVAPLSVAAATTLIVPMFAKGHAVKPNCPPASASCQRLLHHSRSMQRSKQMLEQTVSRMRTWGADMVSLL